MLNKELLRIQNFRGMNTRVSKFLIPDGAAQEAINFIFDEEGVLTVIRGHNRWNSTSLGDGGVQGCARFYRVGHNPELVLVHNGKIYKGDDQTRSFVEVYSGLDVSAPVEMKATRDLLFIANGVNRPVKWDGTNVTLMGLDAPTTAPTASAGGSGNLNGTYSWKVTFVSATMESNGSPVSNQLTVSNQSVNLSNIPISPDPQVAKRRIYRTLAGGTVFKFVGEINDNTTTTFTDNIPDSGLGPDIPFDKDPPPRGRIMEVFKNRLWMAGVPGYPRRLFFSEYFEPEAWPPSYYVDMQIPQGDEITGLKVLGEVLVVYSRNVPLIVIGESPFDFVVKRTFANFGAESNRSIVQVENTHIFLSRFGVYAFDGAVTRLLSDDILPTFRNTTDPSTLKNAAATYYDKRKQYRLSLYSKDLASSGDAKTNNSEWILDLRTSSWTRSTKKIGQYVNLDGPGDKGDIIFTSPSEGLIYTEDDGFTFDGQEFMFRWKSKAFAPRTADIPKQWRYFLMWVNLTKVQLGAEIQIDERLKSQAITFELSDISLSTYGSSQYGSSQYSPTTALVRLEAPLRRELVGNIAEILVEGRSTNATTSPFKIMAVEIMYMALPNLRFKGGN
ncbi:MAG: hypothetical protein QXZ09_03495 [Candidatus Methanomethylicaceae archaeon]